MSFRFMLIVSILAVCGSLGPVSASAQTAPAATFTFLQLEPPGDPASPNYPVSRGTAATGINTANEIVGHDNGFNGVFYGAGGGVLGTFRAPGAVFTDPPAVLPAAITVAYKMNDFGTVVGFKRDGLFTPSQGFIRSAAGVFTRITAPNGEFTDLIDGLGINNHGDIVGVDLNESSWLLTSDGVATQIHVAVSGAGRPTWVADINDLGAHVGRYYEALDGLRHGYYQSGTGEVANIDHPLAASGQTYPTGLNNHGQVVGWYFNTTDIGTSFRHGFVWNAGQFTPLDYQGLNPLGFNGRDTVPNDVNDAGLIVGQTSESVVTNGFIGGHAWLAIPPLVVTLTAPAYIVTTNPAGAPVSFVVSATAGTPTCTADGAPFTSGGTAAVGIHTIVCTSTDLSSGQSANATAQVAVVLSGPAGPQGTAGATGPAGPIGPAGPAGSNGANGADGATGASGPTGPAGPAGAAGTNGLNGADGAVGATGPIGPIGPSGPTGATGATGAIGATGATGTPGEAGTNGVNGVDGAVGPAGPTGASGPVGATGPQGIQGPVGPTGLQGPAGTNGTNAPVQGSLLLLPQGIAAPAGYVRVGSYKEDRIDLDGKGGQKAFNLIIVMWQKL